MQPEKQLNFRVVENSVLARIGRVFMKADSLAMTYGKYIHISGVTKEEFLNNKRWLTHELEHVRQYEETGFLKFLFLYLKESIQHGYYNNRFEAEARNAESKAGKKPGKHAEKSISD